MNLQDEHKNVHEANLTHGGLESDVKKKVENVEMEGAMQNKNNLYYHFF